MDLTEIRNLVHCYIPDYKESKFLSWYVDADQEVIDIVVKLAKLNHECNSELVHNGFHQKINFLINSAIEYSFDNDGKLNPLFEKLKGFKSNTEFGNCLKTCGFID